MHLLAYFNTAQQNKNKSPAELFFKRSLRMPGRPVLPTHSPSSSPEITHSLPPLAVGDHVLIQNIKTKRWDMTGIVTFIRDNHRSYYVMDTDDVVVWRNRIFLRPITKAIYDSWATST